MNKFFVLTLVAFLFSCHPDDRSANGNNSVRGQVKSMIDNCYSDIRKQGLLAELKYLDSSKEFFWIPPGYLNYVSYDSIAAAIRRNAASLKSIDNHYDSLLVIPLPGNHAQFAMRTVSLSVDAEGDTTQTAFIESGVMVKRGDQWKFLSGQTSILH